MLYCNGSNISYVCILYNAAPAIFWLYYDGLELIEFGTYNQLIDITSYDTRIRHQQ